MAFYAQKEYARITRIKGVLAAVVLSFLGGTQLAPALTVPTVSLTRVNSTSYDVKLTGASSGQSCVLLGTTNFSTWTSLATNAAATDGTTTFRYTSASPRQYFRVQLLSPATQPPTNSGNTITAASPAFTDVSNAVYQAKAGDTVVIPAGSAIWVSKTLNITKSITLKGSGSSGTSLTKIQNGNADGTGTSAALIKIQPSTDVPVRVTQIYFDNVVNPYLSGNGYQTPNKGAIRVQGRDYNGSGVGLTQVRIDHNAFNKGKMAVMWSGWSYGLADHNTFTNADIGIGIWADDNFSWTRPIVPGTTNTVVIEDNTFVINNSVDYEPNEQIYHQEGARTTIRKNTFESRAYTTGESWFIDVHGSVGYYRAVNSIDFRGSPLIEIYNNTFNGYNVYRFMYFRGGSLLVHDNTMNATTGGKIGIMLTEEEDWLSGAFSPLRTTWPAEDQINNSFFWNNTVGGAAVTGVSLGTAADATFIQANRDYWMKAPDSTTRTTYPNAGYPSISSYPNVYTSITSYTPLVYPHPFVNSQP